MKLTYWYAECLDDHKCYSIREKTKKRAKEVLADKFNPEAYGPIEKIVVNYSDGFDLLTQALNEGGLSEEW